MTSLITRHFVTVGDRQLHYRRTGQGPPVVLLHQSPTSSRECEPLMHRLAEGHRVFAPDMPGYGASDPLPERHLTVEMLADNVATFMDAVGIGVAGVYGFHTGASVATAFARRHPARVSVSVAVGLLCPTPPERTWLLQNYLPPFVPVWDGSHLAWLWSRLKDQSVFFPWFARTAAAKVAMDASTPAAVQANLPDWLRSGDRYRDAYEAAFRYRPEVDLPSIRTPHFVVDFAADPLFAHLERLPPHTTVDITRCATAGEAQELAADVLRRFPGAATGPMLAPTRPLSGRPWQDYVSVSGMQLRVWRAGDANLRPVLVQHGAQSSVNACAGLIAALGAERCVVGVELPGHGESDASPDPDVYGMDQLAELLSGAIRGLGVTDVELIGVEAGAAAQVALAVRGGVRVTRLSLVSAIDTSHDQALRQRLADSYAVSQPDFYGGHVLRAWHEARDHLLFFPWYERRRDCAVQVDPGLDPEVLQRSATDRILSGVAGCAIRQAETCYPLLSKLASLQCPVAFAAPRSNPRFGHTRSLAGTAGRGFLELPVDAGAWRHVLAE